MQYHIYRSGSLCGKLEAENDVVAESVMRRLYGPAKWLQCVRSDAAPDEHEQVRLRSEALASLYSAGIGTGGLIVQREAVGLRVASHILDHFRRAGPGWHCRIEKALADHVRRAEASVSGEES